MNKVNFVGRIVFSVFLILPFARRMTDWVSWLTLCISLPLAIWISSGWIGLLGHWEAIPAAASMAKATRLRRRSGFKAASAI